MTIYNINKGIGWASSGVEYAQAYRANIFRNNRQTSKFIFTDMFHENIANMTKNIGFQNEEIIWLYQFFTDIKIKETTYNIYKLEKTFSRKPDDIIKSKNKYTYYFKPMNLRLVAYLETDSVRVYKTEILINEKLVQRDYYSYTKVFSEYFKTVDNTERLYMRRFFNQNGSMAYDEVINGSQSLFLFPDRTIYSKEKFLEEFLERLNLSSTDIILIDRSTGIGPQVIKCKGGAKVGVVIHAEHFNEPLSTKQSILWNNYYEYQFSNANNIDFFITATDLQKSILEKQFYEYNKGEIKVYAIPVGSLDQITNNESSHPAALVTASRLASEKHLDWLIKAVVEARKKNREITLDIYGKGGEAPKLNELIKMLDAGEYIRLMGQKDLKDVYKNYSAYISTSTSEGFGLTLLEAVGSGLGIVGFDVRYGNKIFIQDKSNGRICEYTPQDEQLNISNISTAILNILEDIQKNSEGIKETSYKIAENFLTENIQQKWILLEKEVVND